MIVVPIVEAITFFFLLRKPHIIKKESMDKENEKSEDLESNVEPLVGFKEKILYIRHLFIYMIPLTLVYLFEYFINQGLVILN
jgi:battenin